MTGKQRAALRKMANPLDTIIYIGKEGIMDRVVKEVYDALSLTDADKQADESTTEDGEKIEKNLTETDVTIPSAIVSNSEEAAKIAAQNQQAEVADEGIKKLKKLISADALLPTDNAPEEILNLFDDYE